MDNADRRMRHANVSDAMRALHNLSRDLTEARQRDICDPAERNLLDIAAHLIAVVIIQLRTKGDEV